MPLMVLVVGGALGLILLAIGLRGRRVDDHPHCRRCRFDLTGLSTSTESDALPRCPECGAELTQAKAIRIGQRAKRRSLIVSGGLLMLVVAAAIATPLAFTFLYGPNANTFKPTWWLMIEAQPSANPTSDAAIVELKSRLASAKLSNSFAQILVERALAFQADTSKKWNGDWGGVVELARSKGLVDDAQWRRYARHSIVITGEARSKARVGDPYVFRFRVAQRTSGGPPFRTFIQPWQSDLDSNPMGLAFEYAEVPFNGTVSMPHTYKDRWATKPKDIAFGSRSVEIVLNVVVCPATSSFRGDVLVATPDGPQPPQSALDNNRRYGRETKELSAIEPSCVAWNVAVSDTVEIVPRETALCRPVTRDKWRNDIHTLCSYTRLRRRTNSSDTIVVSYPQTYETIATAFDVFVRVADGSEEHVGQWARDAQGKSLILPESSFSLLSHPTTSSMTLIFRPNPDLAMQTFDADEIWGEEVVIENVQVQGQPSAIAPAPPIAPPNGLEK